MYNSYTDITLQAVMDSIALQMSVYPWRYVYTCGTCSREAISQVLTRTVP